MAEAGILNIQIGYENTSDNLLKKIDKKNSFASNLFFIKYALKYGIKVTSLNVLVNLLEEISEDVCEAVNNLRFLRLFRKESIIRHRIAPLSINATSKYC